MERGNKSRDSGRNMKITSVFKVKKCLFDSAVTTEFTSPKLLPKLSAISSNPSSPEDDSPYAMFRQRKCRTANDSICKMEVDSSTVHFEIPQKRNSVVDMACENKENMEDGQHMDELSPNSSNSLKQAVQKAVLYPNLIGDFSKPCILPVIDGKHPDLKCISPDTVADLLLKFESLSFTLVDCRYPYEYEGGHIKNAINLYHKEEAEKDLLTAVVSDGVEKKNILVFYCEFSSERAPNMIRFIRSKDRALNKTCYPFLHYPEVYLIEGGYKAFYADFKELCDPEDYMTMLDKECSEKLAFFRAKCKTFKKNTKQAKRIRF